jgi:hypothetical protein
MCGGMAVEFSTNGPTRKTDKNKGRVERIRKSQRSRFKMEVNNMATGAADTATTSTKKKSSKKTTSTSTAKKTKSEEVANTVVEVPAGAAPTAATTTSTSKSKKSKLVPKTEVEVSAVVQSEAETAMASTPSKMQQTVSVPVSVSVSAQSQPQPQPNSREGIPNVIVRLRCQMSDLKTAPVSERELFSMTPYEYRTTVPDIKTYNFSNAFSAFSCETADKNDNGAASGGSSEQAGGEFAYLDTQWLHNRFAVNSSVAVSTGLEQIGIDQLHEIQCDSNPNSNGKCVQGCAKGDMQGNAKTGYWVDKKEPLTKDIQAKIFNQKVLLYHGLVQSQKKSACFWCTCDYDTPICAIPYYNADGTLDCYGSFCRPECAVAYLYKEKLDDSVRVDRDQMINYYYGKAYGYDKRIKPAPDPHYLLDKFYGNLTIQEYRRMLKSEHLLATLEKPLTRIFPEIHEMTDGFLYQIYGGDINLNRGYRVKRASEQTVRPPTKNEIIREKFHSAVPQCVAVGV